LPQKKYTAEQKAEAVELYRQFGARGAMRRLQAEGGIWENVSDSTIGIWAAKAGVTPEWGSNAAIDGKRSEIIGQTALAITRLLDDLTQPIEKKQVTKDGTVVVYELSQPEPQDKRSLATSAAILIDKLQLMTGEATQRVDQMDAEQVKDLILNLAQRQAK
jgi:hypothetical protein